MSVNFIKMCEVVCYIVIIIMIFCSDVLFQLNNRSFWAQENLKPENFPLSFPETENEYIISLTCSNLLQKCQQHN